MLLTCSVYFRQQRFIHFSAPSVRIVKGLAVHGRALFGRRKKNVVWSYLIKGGPKVRDRFLFWIKRSGSNEKLKLLLVIKVDTIGLCVENDLVQMPAATLNNRRHATGHICDYILEHFGRYLTNNASDVSFELCQCLRVIGEDTVFQIAPEKKVFKKITTILVAIQYRLFGRLHGL